MTDKWTSPVRLREIDAGPIVRRLAPDDGQRAQIARELGLQSLPSLTAELTVRPWMGGAEISGRFDAVVEQICAVSLDAFEHPLGGEIDVRAVPSDSPGAPPSAGGEIDYDPDAPDPPDLLEGDTLDLAAYVVEHLALEIDPFARKPGAAFDYTPDAEPESPFAALKKLRDPKP